MQRRYEVLVPTAAVHGYSRRGVRHFLEAIQVHPPRFHRGIPGLPLLSRRPLRHPGRAHDRSPERPDSAAAVIAGVDPVDGILGLGAF